MEKGIREYIFEDDTTSSFLVVNNAVVDLALTDVVGVSPLIGDAGEAFFAFGDNIFIESVRVQLPFSFGNGKDNTELKMIVGYRDGLGNVGLVTELGNVGGFRLPSYNIDFPINTFIPQPSNVLAKWGLEIAVLDGRVSMLSVPAVLNASTIRATVFMNVRHTFARVA